MAHVDLTFMEAWELLNAAEQRLTVLGEHAQRTPMPMLTEAMARLITARDKVRDAFGLAAPTEAQLDAAHEAWCAEMVELADADLPDVPLADWAPGEITEAWGR